MKKYLYHLTTKDAVDSILANGIRPSIGERSKMVGEIKPAIYLCDKKDIPYWQAILGLNYVVQIDASDMELSYENTYKTMSCTEYMWGKLIPSEKLMTVKKVQQPKKEIMHRLCLDYMRNISCLCVMAARYYSYTDDNRPYNIDKEELRCSMATTLAILNRLDYSVCTTKEMRAELREMGDGGYSFVDRYKFYWEGPFPRLYTMLVKYEKDELYPVRHELYKFITKNFKGCLDVDTGGWTN